MTSDGVSTAQARALLVAYRDRQVTLAEAALLVDTRHSSDDDPIGDALSEVFPQGATRAPDPAVTDLLLAAMTPDIEHSIRTALIALALRRPVLAATIRRVESGHDALLQILRPGCRVMLGMVSGRAALRALVAGDIAPATDWLERNMVDADAFAATTLDVPLGSLAALGEFVDQLVTETEQLPPGRARARVADEWVSEVMVDSLDDETPYTEIVRVVGGRLLESDAPALLWHAATQLSLVAGGDLRIAERVLERCLPLARLEDGRSPAAAAAPFLTVLPPVRAAAILERLAPDLDEDGWDAVARAFLAGAFRTRWTDWSDHAERWAGGADAGLARAATSALTLAARAA